MKTRKYIFAMFLLAVMNSELVRASDVMDAIVTIQAFPSDNQLEGGHLCKGIIVSETQILTVNDCILNAKEISISNSVLNRSLIIGQTRVSNSLILITATTSITESKIEPISVVEDKWGKLDQTSQIEVCGKLVRDSSSHFAEHGLPSLDSEGRAVSILLSETQNPQNMGQKVLSYACISSEIIAGIMK
jgi:hypothetical protein